MKAEAWYMQVLWGDTGRRTDRLGRAGSDLGAWISSRTRLLGTQLMPMVAGVGSLVMIVA